MGKCVLLVDVQRIHISAQRDRAPALHRSPQGADDASAGNSAFDLDAERFEAFGDERSRFVLLERGLWVGVDLVPSSRHFGMKICNAIDDRHWRASLLKATAAWRAKRLPVNRSSLSRVVARRVLFPRSRNRPGMAKYWGARSASCSRPPRSQAGSRSGRARRRTPIPRQRPSDRMPNPNGAAARIPRGASNWASAGQARRPGTQLFLTRPPGVKGGFPPTGADNPRCA
jgi:hypothetical protein